MVVLAITADSAASSQAAQQQDEDCGDRAVLVVTVGDESGLIRFPNATVVLRWADAVRRPLREPTDSDGRLLRCVPTDVRQATLWAEFGDASSEESVVTFEPGAAHEVQLRLLFGETRTGRLIGQVRDARTDEPVATAAISITGRPEVVASDQRGRFALSGIPVGGHELSVQHLGYATLTHPVTVTRGLTTEVEVGLTPDPLELEPLVATATRPRRLEVRGFYERRYWGELTGNGTFFTAEDIERRAPLRITHMVAEAPGVRLANCNLQGHGCRLYSTRASTGFSSEGCQLNVYLDGNLVVRGSEERWSRAAGDGPFRHDTPPQSLNDLVMPDEIAGLEVYVGAAGLPAEFGGSDSRCGAVVIWTR
ncbi:MAG: carboxypeptidase-like regulatory domain-containing protein [Gemmatimonadetes bacterium]|nr:carboxypeptidase-like regulatory domain-containing protein [Candidatus Palauibacter rhopaloidicola]